MSNFRRTHLGVGLALLIVSSRVVATTSDVVGGTEWKSRMRDMLVDVVALVPYAFDENQLNDPANAPVVQKSLDSLAKHSTGLKNHTASAKLSKEVKIDPSYRFLADAFDRQVKDAQVLFSQGGTARDQSLTYIRGAISKCALCHSQSSTGSEFKFDQFNAKIDNLRATDRTMALIATRQFDKAMAEFKAFLKKPQISKVESRIFDRSARSALAVAVRVKNDPQLVKSLVEDVIASEMGSGLLQNDLKGWIKSAQIWSVEPKETSLTDQKLFMSAKRLIDDVKKKPIDQRLESSDVEYLRASSKLHELLVKYPKSPYRAESFLALASCYASLSGFVLWDLAEDYLGTCIQENPHSEIGEKCFKGYEDSVVFGYTGSSGTHLPSSVRAHLKQMKELAQIKSGSGSSTLKKK